MFVSLTIIYTIILSSGFTNGRVDARHITHGIDQNVRTISKLLTARKPYIFITFPHLQQNHQRACHLKFKQDATRTKQIRVVKDVLSSSLYSDLDIAELSIPYCAKTYPSSMIKSEYKMLNEKIQDDAFIGIP